MRLVPIVVLMSISSLAACSSASPDDTASGEGAATAVAKVPAKGAYKLDDESRGATLTVEAADARSATFSLTVVNKLGGNATGDLGPVTATGADGRYLFTDRNADCRLELRAIDASTLEVVQTGGCGFGANVVANGRYMKSASTQPATQNPAPGTAERKAFIAAVHAKIDPDLHGQKSEYLVSWLQSSGSYAFLTGNIQGPGTATIDWSKTKYADEVRDGLFDGGHFEVLAKKDAQGKWTIVEYGIGSTDVWWVALPTTYPDAPASIFPQGGGE